MKVIRKASPQEMVSVWLQGELQSPRFSGELSKAIKKHNVREELITSPDLNNEEENKQRHKILVEYRKWFNWDPSELKWQWEELTLEELLNLKYLAYSYWNELSNGTGLVKDGAESVKNGKIVFDVSNDNFWSAAKLIDEGVELPALILQKDTAKGPDEVIVEGHLRATAYGIATNPPKTVKAIFGKR